MYFSDLDKASVEDLRRAYHRNAILLHPDKHKAEEAAYYTAAFQDMQREYQEILSRMSGKQYSDAKTSQQRESNIASMIDAVLNIGGAYIELCGTWLWVSGVSFLNRHKIKALGFRWSKTKSKWYWSECVRGRKKKARYTMEQIYDKFGRQIITGSGAAEEGRMLL